MVFLPKNVNPGPQPSLRVLPGGPAVSYMAVGRLRGSYGESTTVTRATNKVCPASDGVSVVTLGSNVAAVGPKGLLVEAAATNLITNSEAFQTGWTAGSATVTANQGVAPDGATTAEKLDLQAVPGVSATELYQTAGFTATAASYTFSVWARTVTGTSTFWIHLGRAGGAGRVSQQCNATTTWQRFSITTTATATTWYPTIGAYSALGQNTAAQSLYIWGAQVELGSYPTSYILTSGGTATRNADAVTMGVGALPVTTGYFEFDFTPLWSTIAAATLVDTRDGSFANGVGLYVVGTTLWFQNGTDSTHAASVSLTWTPGQTYRIRGEFANGVIRLYRDQVLVNTSSAGGTMPSGHSAFRLGARGDGVSVAFDGYLSNFSCGRL